MILFYILDASFAVYRSFKKCRPGVWNPGPPDIKGVTLITRPEGRTDAQYTHKIGFADRGKWVFREKVRAGE